MPPLQFVESGFRVDIPNQAYRFQSLNTYERLKGGGIKELDFCFFPNAHKLVMCELTDLTQVFSQNRLNQELTDCAAKAKDAILMLAAGWLGTACGNDLLTEIQATCTQIAARPVDIMVIFIMKVPNQSDAPMVADLGTRLRNKLSGLTKLYDIKQVTCLTQFTMQPISQYIQAIP